MAKYYRKQTNYANNWNVESYQAIGSERVKTIYGYDEYPTAHVSGSYQPGNSTPNFDFREKRSDSLLRDDETVDKNVGIPEFRNSLSREMSDLYRYAINSQNILKQSRYGLETYGKSAFDRGYHRTHGIEYAKNIRALRQGTSELFTTEPDSLHVHSAFSHTSMRHAVPIMVSHLHQKRNAPIVADNSLSKHSSKMVKNAKEKGLPVVGHPLNPEAKATNDISFNDAEYTTPNPHPLAGYVQIPEHEIKAAKQHFRELRSIGRATPKPLSPQFDQPQLPGMEG
jgi:type III secretion system FlhB-like substrate exporter